MFTTQRSLGFIYLLTPLPPSYTPQVRAAVDCTLAFLYSPGDAVACGAQLATVHLASIPASLLKAARPAPKKPRAEIDAALLEERSIFPIVPPTLTWQGPRLPFDSILRITFHPDFQPDRWNLCTDLNTVLRRIICIALSSPVVNENFEFTPVEEKLIELSAVTQIYSSDDVEANGLATFGVSAKLALADGAESETASPDVGDKRKKGGFAKGTGYSSGGYGAREAATVKTVGRDEQAQQALQVSPSKDRP